MSLRRSLLAAAAVLAAPALAQAHFVWVKIDRAAKPVVARVVFNETTDDGDPLLLSRIDGKVKLSCGETCLDVARRPEALEARLPGPAATTIEGHCDYGVIAKKGPAFLLMYHARAQAEATPADGPLGGDAPRLEMIAREGKAPVFRASYQGKPIAGATILVRPDEGDPSEVKADDAGLLEHAAAAEGKAGLILKVVEPTEGARDGQSYAEVRHYSTLTVCPAPSAAEEVTADDVLRKAHDARASWGPNFPGFTADVAITFDNKTTKGELDVAPDGKVALEIPDGTEKEWAQRQIGSLVMHRGLNGPTHLDPGATFAEPESDHPLGRLIKLADARMGSAYRIKGDEILEVNRTMKDSRFSNKILANARNAEGFVLPLAFTVTYWDKDSGALQRVEAFHDSWTRVGHLDLPKTHAQTVSKAEAETTARLIEFSNHALKAESR